MPEFQDFAGEDPMTIETITRNVLGAADTPDRVGRALLNAVGRIEQVLDDLIERVEALEGQAGG